MNWVEMLALGVGLGAAALMTLLLLRKGKPPALGKAVEAPLRQDLRYRPAEEGDLAISTPGGAAKIHYLTVGAFGAERPPLLFIHGLGGSVFHFSGTLAPELSKDHFVAIVDRPGYGRSTRPASGAASLSEQAAVIRRTAQALELERPVLIGHSFGGAVALAYALEHPEDVSGLVLLAPAVYPFKMKPPLPDETVDTAGMRKTLAWTLGPLMARRNEEMFRDAAFGPQDAPADYAEAGGGAYGRRPSQIEATMEDGSILRPDLAAQVPRYEKIKAPAAMLFGMADRILTYEDHGPPLKAVAPHVALRTLDGIGHMLPFAAPDACVETIRAVAGSDEALRRWRGGGA